MQQMELGAPCPVPEPSQIVEPAAATTDLRARLEAADLESLGLLLDESLMAAEALRQEMEPHRQTAEICRDIIFKRLEAQKRTVLNHPTLAITVETKRDTVKDDAPFAELLTLEIDGMPIPPEDLRGAVWHEDIPAQRILKTNLTKIKPLVKKYGAPVEAIFNRSVQVVERKYLSVKPKQPPALES